MKEVNLETVIIKNIHTSIHTQPYTLKKKEKIYKNAYNFSFDLLQQIFAHKQHQPSSEFC